MNTAVKTPTNAVTAKAAVGKGDVSPKFCKTKNRHGCSYIIAHKRFYILSRLSVMKLGTQRISGMDLKPTKWRTANKSLNWNHLPRIRPINSLLFCNPEFDIFRQWVKNKSIMCVNLYFLFLGRGGGGRRYSVPVQCIAKLPSTLHSKLFNKSSFFEKHIFQGDKTC